MPHRNGRRLALVAVCASVAACGGGGSGSSPPASVTSISGTAAAPAQPPPVTTVTVPGYAGATTATDMMLPLNAPYSAYATIAQTMIYGLNAASLPAVKVTSLSLAAVNTAAATALATGATGYPGDPTRGELSQITNGSWPGYGSGFGPVSTQVTLSATSTLGTVPSGDYASGSIAGVLFGITQPYSASGNPGGPAYQLFGYQVEAATASVSESWFSVGIPATPASIPASGSAVYVGASDGSDVDATTGVGADAESTFTVTVDFATRTATISSAGTAILPSGAAAGASHSAAPSLDLAGSLGFASGSNGLTGTIHTSSGLSGNATCRFYGPGIGAATATKVAGSPSELGCTFAVMLAGTGAMQGAFAAR